MGYSWIRLLGLRTLQSRPLRALLSMLGVLIGVAGILSIGTTNQAALDSISQVFIASSGRSNLVVTSAAGDDGVPMGVHRSLARLPEVAHAVPLLQINTALANGSQPQVLELSFFGSSGAELLLYGIDTAQDSLVRDYRITAGQPLSGDPGAYEVVLVEDYAVDEEIAVGNEIGVVTPTGVERLLVVGLMAREGAAQANSGKFGIIPMDAGQQLFGRNGNSYDQVDLVIEQAGAGSGGAGSLEDARLRIQEEIGSGYAVTYPAGQGQRMTQMLANYQIGLSFLSGIALFVGAFLIYNAFAMSVAERTREFGMLRALGMTQEQVLLLVITEALIMGALGSAGGVVLGTLGARGLSTLMGQLMGTGAGQRITPAADFLALSVGVGIGVTVLAALVPAIQAGRISPIAAIRIQGAAREGWVVRRGWTLGLALMIVSIVTLVWNPFPDDPDFRLGSMTVFSLFTGLTLTLPASVTIWERGARPAMSRLYGACGAIGSRNIDRARVRTMLTLGALMIGVSMILVVRTMTASFAGDLQEWIASYLGGDLYVHAAVPLHADLVTKIQGVEGVDAATPIHYQQVQQRLADGNWQTLNYMAVDPASYAQVTGFVFSDSTVDAAAALESLADGQSVFVSSVLAEKLGLSRGDTIELRTRRGVLPFRVAETVVDFNNQGLVVTGGWQDLRRYFGANTASAILVRVKDQAALAEVQERLDELYGKRYQLSVESNAVIRERIGRLLSQAFGMFDMMGVLAVLVASLGVVNTLTMNVIERTREIGMLRAVGMTRGQVYFMVLAESGLMGLIGGVLGLAIGILLSRLIMHGMTAMSGYRLTFTVPTSGVVTALVVSLVVSQLAALMPARRAANINVLAALHHE